MTKKELSKLYYLNRDIEREKQQLEELRARGTSTTAKVTGLPHVSGVSDKVGDYAIEIADLEKLIEIHTAQSIREYKRLNLYIQGIDDPQMRLILSLRHVQGYSWTRVAMEIGGGNTADSVRMAHDRFLEK